MKTVFLIIAFIAGATFFASAQSTPKVAKIQAKQTVRIAQGVGSGELTKREAKKLRNQQRHIQAEKRRAKADGAVTKAERAHIRSDQKIANRSIYRQKHDTQNRLY